MSETIEEALFAFLQANAAVYGMVKTRIYPLRMPDDQKTWPALVYAKASGPREVAHDRGSGMGHPRMQLSCYADTYLAAKKLALVIVQALNGYGGPMDQIANAGAYVDNEVDLYEKESRLYKTVVDVIILHQEPVS